jgi:addiction module HigA family antidote
MSKLLPPIHPGETIREDILKPLDMSVNQLAKALSVDAARLNEIVRGRRGITADTALRLSRYLGTSSEFWLGLQADYDLRVARQLKLKKIERGSKSEIPRRLGASGKASPEWTHFRRR